VSEGTRCARVTDVPASICLIIIIIIIFIFCLFSFLSLLLFYFSYNETRHLIFSVALQLQVLNLNSISISKLIYFYKRRIELFRVTDFFTVVVILQLTNKLIRANLCNIRNQSLKFDKQIYLSHTAIIQSHFKRSILLFNA